MCKGNSKKDLGGFERSRSGRGRGATGLEALAVDGPELGDAENTAGVDSTREGGSVADGASTRELFDCSSFGNGGTGGRAFISLGNDFETLNCSSVCVDDDTIAALGGTFTVSCVERTEAADANVAELNHSAGGCGLREEYCPFSTFDRKSIS